MKGDKAVFATWAQEEALQLAEAGEYVYTRGSRVNGNGLIILRPFCVA